MSKEQAMTHFSAVDQVLRHLPIFSGAVLPISRLLLDVNHNPSSRNMALRVCFRNRQYSLVRIVTLTRQPVKLSHGDKCGILLADQFLIETERTRRTK